MSKKNTTSSQSTKRPGRAPMTAEQKAERAAAKALAKSQAKAVKAITKHITALGTPEVWAGVPAEQADAVKTAINGAAKLRKAQIDELEARLAALKGEGVSPEAEPAQATANA